MRHNPNNSQCDKNVYAGADDIKCTCDIDDADNVPAPSVSIAPAGPPAVAAAPGQIVLTGRSAQTYAELVAATRELDAARKLLTPAEARWRSALDAHSEAMLFACGQRERP